MRAFYGRRARRLLPALVVTIALVGLIYLLRPDISEGAGFGWTAIAALFYAANFSHLDLALFTPTWSLSLEEQFYILWPPLLVLCLRGKWGSRRILGLVLFLAILISASRTGLWLSIRDAFSLNWRADGLLLGCALAVARRAPEMRRLIDRLAGPILVPLGAAALLVLYAFAPPPLRVDLEGGLSLVAVAAGVVIVHATIGQPSLLNRLLSLAVVVWVGKRSYGIYLYHLPIIVAFRTLPLPYWPSTIAAVAVTVGLAALSYRFIESPFLRGKHYHTAAPASSPARTAAVEPA
jgi:peptidoglycan/LPS O-acetylase OafA/YrhL